MPIVKFNDVEEFCEELKKEVAAGRVPEGGIVRVTNLFKPSSLSPNIRHVLVVTTFSIGGHVTRLERYCGDLWGLRQAADEEVMKKAALVQAAVESACQNLQLEVRGGMLEE